MAERLNVLKLHTYFLWENARNFVPDLRRATTARQLLLAATLGAGGAAAVQEVVYAADIDCTTGFIVSAPLGESLVIIEEDAITGQLVGEINAANDTVARFRVRHNDILNGQLAFRGRVFNKAIPDVKQEFIAACGSGPRINFSRFSGTVEAAEVTPTAILAKTPTPTLARATVVSPIEGIAGGEPVTTRSSNDDRLFYGLLIAGSALAAGIIGGLIARSRGGVYAEPGERPLRWRERVNWNWLPGRRREVAEGMTAEEARNLRAENMRLNTEAGNLRLQNRNQRDDIENLQRRVREAEARAAAPEGGIAPEALVALRRENTELAERLRTAQAEMQRVTDALFAVQRERDANLRLVTEAQQAQEEAERRLAEAQDQMRILSQSLENIRRQLGD